MSEFFYLKNILVLETASLGFAYTLIQKYTAGTEVKVFEVAPTPRGAVLVLAASQPNWLEGIESEVKNHDLVENVWLSDNVSEKVIAAYLNQSVAPLKEHLLLIESDSICESLKALTVAIKAEMVVCEFRIFRSAIYKCVISLSTKLTMDEVTRLYKLISGNKILFNYIANPTAEIRQQFDLG